jgi:multiple antibiotic resistance protein
MFYIRSAGSVGGILAVVAALVAVILVTFGCLRFASVIGRLLGANGISVLTRLLGLLVTAIGVQLVAGGVLALTRR